MCIVYDDIDVIHIQETQNTCITNGSLAIHLTQSFPATEPSQHRVGFGLGGVRKHVLYVDYTFWRPERHHIKARFRF